MCSASQDLHHLFHNRPAYLLEYKTFVVYIACQRNPSIWRTHIQKISKLMWKLIPSSQIWKTFLWNKRWKFKISQSFGFLFSMTYISPRSHFPPIKKSYKEFCKNWKNILNWGKLESPELIPVAFEPQTAPKQNLPQMHPPKNKPQNNFLKQISIL